MSNEWAVNIQRDSYASYIGHYPILAYFAITENESVGRERYNFMQVRRCAQVCVEMVFMSFESTVRKRASNMVWSLFNHNMPLAIELSAIRIVDGSKSELLSQPKHLEVLHMLNSLKLLFPFLSKKVTIKLLPDLYKLLGCHFSPLTRHILDILGVLFEFSRVDISCIRSRKHYSFTCIICFLWWGESSRHCYVCTSLVKD